MSVVRAVAPTGPSSRGRLARMAAAPALPTGLVGAALLGVPAAHAAVPAGPGSLTVAYGDGAVDWTVPAGVYELSVIAVGGSGADGRSTSDDGIPLDHAAGTGGRGAFVRAAVPVVPGEHLQLQPGAGADAGNGGNSGSAGASGQPGIGPGGLGGTGVDTPNGRPLGAGGDGHFVATTGPDGFAGGGGGG